MVVGVKLSGLIGRNLHTEHAYTIVSKNLAEAVIKFQVYWAARDGAMGWTMYVEIVMWNSARTREGGRSETLIPDAGL